MGRRTSYTDHRRQMLARQVASLEALEKKAMITESLGMITLGIGVPAMVAAFAPKVEAGTASKPSAAPRPPHAGGPSASSLVDPFHSTEHGQEGGWQTRDHKTPQVQHQGAASSGSNDWLTLSRRSKDRTAKDGLSPHKPVASAAAAGRRPIAWDVRLVGARSDPPAERRPADRQCEFVTLRDGRRCLVERQFVPEWGSPQSGPAMTASHGGATSTAASGAVGFGRDGASISLRLPVAGPVGRHRNRPRPGHRQPALGQRDGRSGVDRRHRRQPAHRTWELSHTGLSISLITTAV